MQTLQIVETAYRATLEEQDDPVLWLARAMRDAGAELAVLLCGNAVNYAVARQGVTLQIGAWVQERPPQLPGDILALVAKGVPVFVIAEDAADRGIAVASLVPQVGLIGRAQLPAFLAEFARVWRW